MFRESVFLYDMWLQQFLHLEFLHQLVHTDLKLRLRLLEGKGQKQDKVNNLQASSSAASPVCSHPLAEISCFSSVLLWRSTVQKVTSTWPTFGSMLRDGTKWAVSLADYCTKRFLFRYIKPHCLRIYNLNWPTSIIATTKTVVFFNWTPYIQLSQNLPLVWVHSNSLTTSG